MSSPLDQQLGEIKNQGELDQYLTFILAGEEYGINILKVVEIRGMTPPTPVPLAPTYVKGVINLRGNIIPVVDLRERLHIESIPYNQSTVVIIVNTNRPDENKVIGVIVDAVSDVYKISKDEIKPKPAACNLTDNEYIEGLVSVKQANDNTKLVIIINIDKLMDIREIYASKMAVAEGNAPT